MRSYEPINEPVIPFQTTSFSVFSRSPSKSGQPTARRMMGRARRTRASCPTDEDRTDCYFRRWHRWTKDAADDLGDGRQQASADLLEVRFERRVVLPLSACEKQCPAFRPIGGETFEEGLHDRAQQLEELGAREIRRSEG